MDAGLEALAIGCPNIQEIQLYHCKHITELSIISISQYCHKIWKIEISDSQYQYVTTDRSIIALLEGCPLLEYIDIASQSLVTYEGIIVLAHRCRNIQHINLSACQLITDISIIALSWSCSNIHIIYLANCNK